MLKHFINLQWKSFFRSASFKTNLALKIIMVFGAIWTAVGFLALGLGAYPLLERLEMGDPLELINKFMIYYMAVDLMFRYAIQKMPITNLSLIHI